MNRSQFLKRAGMLAACGLVKPDALWANQHGTEAYRLTILHTNDTHSRIDPFPEAGGKYAGMGGAAKRASMIKVIRQEQPNVLLLDSGDVFQGTPYFNMYGGKLELELMSEMGYVASTLGNHEFDNGVEGLVEALESARFSMVNVNYDIEDGALKEKIQPFIIQKVGNIKVGIFGVGLNLDGLVSPKLTQGIRYRDPIVIARLTARSLRRFHKCDLVICLSHLGYRYRSKRISDAALAPYVEDVDIILGGHTHTFMQEPDVFEHASGRKTLIHQVGFGGIWLGRLDIVFNDSGTIAHVAHGYAPVNRA